MASDTAGTGIPGTDLRDADRANAVTANEPASKPGQPNGRVVLRPAEARLLERDLAAAVDGEVRFDAGTRGAYSTDASNFRQVPIGVVVPRTVEAAVAAVAVCREHGVAGAVPRRRHQPGRAVHQHGGRASTGRSTATACSTSTPSARTCVVEPGIVLDVLNDAARAARPALRPGARHAHELHARRDDRQQLLRRDRAAHRQGRRQHRRAWRCCSTTAPGSGAGRPATTSTPRSSGAATGGREIYRRLRALARRLRRPDPARATRTSRAGSPATTSTRCCPSTASTSPGCWSAASPRWSPCCGPS